MSIEQAGGFPAVFLTAWYALFELAHPRAGSTMLVHSAAGGVGSALVQLGKLAGVLENQTKAQPERFARLMLTFPNDANEHYFGAVVMGLNGGGLPLDLLHQLIERTHNRPDHPHGRWTPRTIASHRDRGLSTALLDVIAWYATEDPNPVSW